MPQMQEPERLDAPGEERKNPTSGQWLWKTLKPAGCVLVLVIAAAMVLLCLTQGRDPIDGYAPPETMEYYSAHLDALALELEEHVFPHVEGVTACTEKDGRLEIVIDYAHFVVTRSALLRYFDGDLFTLVQAPEKP